MRFFKTIDVTNKLKINRKNRIIKLSLYRNQLYYLKSVSNKDKVIERKREKRYYD